MAKAADDTFERRIWEFTEHKYRNSILVNFSNVDVPGIKNAFMERMRQRYDPSRDVQTVNIAQSEWHAFRLWVENSSRDRVMGQDFWRRSVGRSRKKLARAINFLYPGGVVWSSNPIPIIDSMFPIDELKRLLNELPDDEPLEEIEKKGIERIGKLFAGTYPTPDGPMN